MLIYFYPVAKAGNLSGGLVERNYENIWNERPKVLERR